MKFGDAEILAGLLVGFGLCFVVPIVLDATTFAIESVAAFVRRRRA